MVKKVIFYKEFCDNSIFELDLNVEYDVVMEDSFTVYIEDNNGKRIGIDKMADKTIVALLDDTGNTVNVPFVTEQPAEE